MVSYVLRELPVGIEATGTRRERDSGGSIEVPADKYWGAATQRALNTYPATADSLPDPLYRCYGYVKRVAAMINGQAGRLPLWKTAAIARAANDLIGGLLDDQFPLPVWQASCDADTNVNEVLANRAAQLLGAAPGSREPIDAARDVNMAQLSRVTFTAALYIATIMEIEEVLVPRASALARVCERNARIPPSHDQRLRVALARLDEAESGLHEIAMLTDPAVRPEMTAEDWQGFVAAIAAATHRPFIVAAGEFSDAGSLDTVIAAFSAVRGLAFVVSGVAEALHASQGASWSVRSQLEASSMICMHVIGQDQVVISAASRGQGMPRPLIAASVLDSIRRLGEACETLRRVALRAR